MNRSPAFKRFVIPGFPVCEFRENHDAWLKLEDERGLVLKSDFDNVVIGRNIQFHGGNALAFCLRESENASLVPFLSYTGAGSLRDSHVASQEVIWSGAHSVLYTGRVPPGLIAVPVGESKKKPGGTKKR